MKILYSGWKGLIGLVALGAFALLLVWLFRTAGQEPAAGQAVSPTGTASFGRLATATAPAPTPEVIPTATVLPPSQEITPTATLSPTVGEAPTATLAGPEKVRILYAVQPPGEAVTLWILDNDPATGEASTQELTTSPYEAANYLRAYEVSVSPDGQYVALNLQNVQTPWEYAIWTAQIDGVWLNQRFSKERFHSPVFLDWMPDSQRMLVGDREWLVGTVSIDGENSHTLLSFRADDRTVPDAAIYLAVADAAISPDGVEAAFSITPEDAVWFLSLDENRLDVSTIRTFPVPPRGQGGAGPQGMTWAPDGGRLAYFETLASEMSQIQVMDVATGEVSLLSSDDAHNLSPVWSGDSKALVYIRETTPGIIGWDGGDPADWNSSVWIADVESGRYSELVPSEGKASWSATWLPGGSGVVFVSNRKGQSDVWIVNRDGTGLRPLTDQGDVVALDVVP